MAITGRSEYILKKYRIEKGEELIAGLSKHLKEDSISKGAIVSLLGGISSCKIHTMPKSDPTKSITAEFNEPLELSGTGSIENGEIHIHAVFGREDKSAIMGHLHWAEIDTWFVDVHVLSS